MIWKAFRVFVFIIWIVLIGMLIRRNAGDDTIEVSDEITQFVLEEREDWKGVYYRGRKIGYSSSIRRRIEGDEYSFNQETFFRFPILGQIQEVYIEGVTITDLNFKPVKFRMDVNSEGHEFSLYGKVTGNKLLLRTTTAGKPSERTIMLDDNFSLPVTFEAMMSKGGLEVGEKFSAEVFDPLTTGTTLISAEVVGIDTLNIKNEKVEAKKLKIRYQGIESYTWVDDEGGVLKEEAGIGMVMISETKAKALKMPPHTDLIGEDMALDVAIFSNVKIEKPREVFYMKVALSNADLSQFKLDGTNQRVVSNENGVVILEIDHGILEARYEIAEGANIHPDITYPLQDENFAQWLESDMLIQSDDEKIKKQAKKIVGDQTKLWDATEQIVNWVHSELRKVPVPSVPSALDVLETKEGDCNEHSTLATALLRSLGIPTKIAVGLVYLEGVFYYHAWIEVWDGKRWVPSEPTFGNTYADATHIKLLEGGLENYISLLQVIGRLKLEVLEYKAP